MTGSVPESSGRDGLRPLDGTSLSYWPLSTLGTRTERLPVTVKILLEGLARLVAQRKAPADALAALARWPERPAGHVEIPFMPARVLMQDFTGVPAVVDLAAMRDAVRRAGKDPRRIDPLVPIDLVIDHSVQVDRFGLADAYARNIDREYERNAERYAFLRWAQQAFDGLRVVPPGMGICHQVNLEYLSRVVQVRDGIVVPDTVLGTDSHTTMVNGLGVLGWGVGGIEAEAAMLGQPMPLPWPVVIGVRFGGELPPGSTATDLVLTLTELLRKRGVVNAFVEFCGEGLSGLSVADRATLSNMCPEYGATAALFPVDDRSLEYLRLTGRERELVSLVERYTKAQGLFRTAASEIPVFDDLQDVDLSGIVPSLAGPKRPQDRVSLSEVWSSFVAGGHRPPSQVQVERFDAEGGAANEPHLVAAGGPATATVEDGSVVIAAITSCTNTSNPSVMVAAGLLAKKAVERGLTVRSTVKTSLAPGSRVVTGYLRKAGLLAPLEQLGFYLVGYGCTTCIGNSGPLADLAIEAAVNERDLNVVAVLSGNRNFEGRIHPLVRSSYLASPPLVVAFALAGTVRRDLSKEPLGRGNDGRPVYLRDIWPSPEEVERTIAEAVGTDLFQREYSTIFDGDARWRTMAAPTGPVFQWDPSSTYVKEPPFFGDVAASPGKPTDLLGARALLVVGDSVTTDHISPAGAIATTSPAGRYLSDRGVLPLDLNSYGTRRGNDEVMSRGTFANIRLRNQLVPGKEGPWTRHLPDGEVLSIYDAAMRYRDEGVPLIAIAGKEYGSGSSRDWAAKGPALLGIRAVIAESFERIHRSNLVGMGILPLELPPGTSASALGLTGEEVFSVRGIADGLTPRKRLTVEALRADGARTTFEAVARIDNATDLAYFSHGGVLPMVLRELIAGAA